MFILGVTGQSGSGKTTFAKYLTKYGFEHIDTDLIARQIIPDALPQLINAFGADIMANEKTLNRKKLAKKAFSSPENTELLNKITHPFITDVIKDELKLMEYEGKKRVVIDGAALIEAKTTSLCTKTVTVFADEKVRISRIRKRDNISPWQAKQRLSAQKPLEFYTTNTDYSVENNTYEQLLENAENLIKQLKLEEKEQ